MDERGGELHALLVAERQLLDAVAARSVNPSRSIQRPADVGGRAGLHPVQPRQVDELVAHAHLRVQAALLGHVAEPRAGLEVDRPALEQHLTAVGGEHAEHDPHGGRLAGPVRADEAEHLAALDGEGDPVEGDDVSVAAREVPQLEHASSGSAATVRVRCG